MSPVSITTAQSAFRVLREQGLTYSVHGRGTFVRQGVEVDDQPAPGGGPSPEYLALRQEVERLAEEVQRIHQRLDELSDQSAAEPRSRPATAP